MTVDNAKLWTAADEGDLLARAGFRLTVIGRGTAWVRAVHGSPDGHVTVDVSLDQLTLLGPLDNVRERVRTILSLLDEVEANPDKWEQLRPRRVSEKRWMNHQPRPFVCPPLLG